MKMHGHSLIGIRNFLSTFLFQSLIFFMVVGGVGHAFAASFSADMVKEEDGKIETCKFFMLGEKYRMEVEEDGMKGTILVDRTVGKTRFLVHDKKEYREMNNNDFFVLISNPFEAYEMMLEKFESRSGGSEKIDGIECDKVILSNQGKDAVTAWVAKPYAFLIRLENHGNGNTYALKNIKEGPMEEAYFQIPAGYSKMEDPAEKRAREEADLSFLTTTAKGKAPWARRIGPSGEMRAAVHPEETVRIKFENFTQAESVFSIKGYRSGRPIDLDCQRTRFSLQGKGRRDECMVGPQNQAEEISVIVEKGVILAEVFNEKSVFSHEDKITSFFIATNTRDWGQGTYVDPKRGIRLTITSDSQDSAESKIKITFYRDQDKKDKADETDVVLINGQNKTWDYPAEMGIQHLNIDVAKGGGVQVILEQPAPVAKAVKKTPQPKVREEFTVTHPKGTARLLSPGKDLAMIVTGVSPDASGVIRLYTDRNQTKKIDTFSFKLNKDETEAQFVYGSRQVGWASVEVHRGSFKVKLDQSSDARAEVAKHKKKPAVPQATKPSAPAPAPSAKTKQSTSASSETILNGEAPLMKGASVLKEMGTGPNSRVDFQVPASPQQVVDFYKEVMTAKGWQPGMSIVQGPMGVIQMSKGTSQIMLKAQGDGQKSIVNMAVITR